MGEKQLIRLVDMSEDHFSELFYSEGFAKKFVKDNIASFKSLSGFHMTIAYYGRFDTHRRAVELGYDVEFLLDQS